ncbi:MAG: uracil-DNA glycosylase [Candidatus Omnitrophica bacterium]|nr:uracil-DNA glycosylase [Candidatus Omnitrophota bacterium]MBU1128551.1 uracil-DNA glycosylase [Candidatus Omnitrophota bacterium]MBU1783741.1 uracil-DNA glycosylase [Candidatus Omnitrophota bacterium]MBU1851738.1 uracil-DNA glycosylase [Candidatus Omnitrophota bacterium]
MNKEFYEIIDSLKAYVDGEKISGEREICFLPRDAKAESSIAHGLAVLKEKVSSCQKCPLAGGRMNVVFGEGNPNAPLMFVGEAPGADEDSQGKPFVGRAGQLLTKIIGSIGLTREDVYIANILKCRPPGNRNPLPGEIAACSPHLVKQIGEIKPRVICALGKFAAQTLLSSEAPISRLRGKFHDYLGVKLMPTYHPAYLLRNSSGKKDVWDDMKAISKELGLTVP